MATIGSLIVDLGANTARFASDLNKAQKKSKSFTSKIKKQFKAMRRSVNRSSAAFKRMGLAIVAVATVGFALLVRASFKTIDALAKTADKLGISTKALAGLQHAAELTGVAQNTLEKSLTKMQKAIFDADRGLLTYKQHFDALNLSTKDMMKLSPDQQFAAIAEALNKVENQTLKTAIAYDIFGGRGTALINTLKLGAQGLREVAKEAEILGIAVSRVDAAKIEESNDAWTRVKASIQGVANIIAVQLAPFIKFISDLFVQASKDSNGFRDQVLSGVTAIVKAVAFMGDVFRGLKVVWGFLNIAFQGFVSGVVQQIAFIDRIITATVGMLPGVTATVNQNLQELAAATTGVLLETIEKQNELLNQPMPSAGIDEFMQGLRDQAQERAEMRVNEVKGVADTQALITKIEQKALTQRQKFEKFSMKSKASMIFGELQNITQGVATHNKELFALNKAAAIANAIINTYQGVTNALAAYPPPWSFVMAAAQLAAGLAQVSAISSASFGGSVSAPSIGGGGAAPVTDVTPIGTQQATGITDINITISGSGMMSPDQLDDLAESIRKNLDNGGQSPV